MMLRYLVFLLLLCLPVTGFEKVVIWGHKLHSHTHSYIHNSFYRAFLHLGYPTYWFDDQDDVSDFDFSNSLFLTEGQVDKMIPLREDAIYLLHNPASNKYQSLCHAFFQVYTDDILSYPNLIRVADCIYYDLAKRTLFMPWATDLLPKEIDEIKENLPNMKRERIIWWVGTLSKEPLHGNLAEISEFITACEENGIPFYHSNPWLHPISTEEHISLISSSYMAPALVGTWQKKKGYIPCRLFKNISYGQMGITNSLRAYELFQKKIVYHPDCHQLFFEAEAKLAHYTIEEQKELMDFVRDHHTYLNRVATILDFLEKVESSPLTSQESSSSS